MRKECQQQQQQTAVQCGGQQKEMTTNLKVGGVPG
jgi:hypothetical protein